MNEKSQDISMNKADDKSIASGTTEAKIAPADQPLETILQRLPSHFRKEILKQYELPETKVSIMTILRYATPLEVAMQILGLICAITAGIASVCFDITVSIGAALPLMTILLGSLTNLFGGFTSPGTPSIVPPASPEEFKSGV